MRIGIINFHFAHNYGAVLQCVALQKTLLSLGHEVVVIDYRPEYMAQQFAAFANPVKYARWANRDFIHRGFPYRLYRMARRAAQAIVRCKGFGVRKARMRAFEPFIGQNEKLTRRYHTIGELAADPPVCDAYVCGSDQIWNPYVTSGGLDRAYFLDFGPETALRVAYAVSPCQLDVEKYAGELRGLLGRFDALSLREAQHKVGLEKLLARPVEVCADPTLLLRAEDYAPLEKRPEDFREGYILAYAFRDRDDPHAVGKVIDRMHRATGLPVVNLSHDAIPMECAARRVRAASPGEFLYYIRHANCVITNSFHGTAFSLIYRKPFWSVEKRATASRARELLAATGLQDRLIVTLDETALPEAMTRPVAYETADVVLQEMRVQATNYLVEALRRPA